MACLAISITDVNLLFIGAKEIYFYQIIFEIQTKNIFEKVICKMSVFSGVPASMSQCEPFELHVNCRELFAES